MRLETLLLCRDVLGRMSLSVGADDFREQAARVVAALDDLDAAIAATREAGE